MELTAEKEKEFKKTEVGWIPEDWEIHHLRDCLNEPLQYGIGAAASEYNSNLPRYLRITDISDDGNLIEDNKASVNVNEYKNYLLQDNDIVLARTGASVGKSFHFNSIDFNGEVVFAGFLIKVKTNRNKLHPLYLKYYLQSDEYWGWVKVNSMRSGQPGINSQEYSSLKVPLPPTLEEQEAIAEALSDVDELIHSLDSLIEKKSNIKKGAMQQLLTGNRRLDGFSGEWEVRRMGELCSTINDGTHFTPKYVESGKPFYSVENVVSDDFSNVKNISKREHNFLIKRCKPEKGDILLTRIGTLGITRLIDWDVDASIYVSLALLKPNGSVETTYLYSYTKSELFVGDVKKRALTNATPQKINMGEISNIPIHFPTNRSEQIAIGHCLLELDQELNFLRQTRDKYKQIKQGMMQELLTGRVRLE